MEPQNADSWLKLGLALQQQQRPADALRCYERAIELRGDLAQAHNNRGALLAASNRVAEALESFDRAVALKPDYAQALSNRGAALTLLNRLDQALEDLDRAIALAPSDAASHSNRGNSLSRLGRYDEALASYQRALAYTPEHASTRWNVGVTELRLGRFATGWVSCEYRWKRPKAAGLFRHGSVAPWRGESIADKRVLVWAEQGLGDTLHFCRYAPMLEALGAQVVLEVQPELKPLLASLKGVAELCAIGQPLGPLDFQLPLLSLPLAFGTQLQTIPAKVPYLWADPDRVARWSRRLGEVRALPRIGIACSGNPAHENDLNRSLPLEHFRPLYGRAELYLLQKDVRAQDETELHRSPLRDVRNELVDFAETAALIECLDLVISVDTAVVHLAGALARPVWVLLSSHADWRWMLQRTDSPWYPSARLFRQRRLGEWTGVIEQINLALSEWRA